MQTCNGETSVMWSERTGPFEIGSLQVMNSTLLNRFASSYSGMLASWRQMEPDGSACARGVARAIASRFISRSAAA